MSLRLNLIPKKNNFAKRRRTDDGVKLILYSKEYKLNDLADTVWCNCNGINDIAALVNFISIYESLPLEIALKKTILILKDLEKINTIELIEA